MSLCLLGVLSASLLGCGAGLRRFAQRPVVWTDPDQRLFSPRPPGFYSPYIWDGVDNAFFRPVSEFWLFEPETPAINVNAVDEVPDSSWFQNRLSRHLMSPEEVGRGACAQDFEMPGPWTIVAGKPDGANPGFQIRDANGVRYLMKTEGTIQPWRPAAADTIGAAIYHAAGYYAPCNRVVHFDRSILVRDPDAEIERSNGSTEPLTNRHIDEVLEQALLLPDGRYRASVSQFVDGRPISAWTYEGHNDNDPNDVVDHEHRREVRGMYLLAAWTNHVDSRQENTMAAWMQPIDEHEEGYVRHYMIDFGDCFGALHSLMEIVRRVGNSGYIDFEHIIEDFVTLDLIDRPWFNFEYGPAGVTLGYYDVAHFTPDRWRPGYPNPAFDRATEQDNAWMARIIARFRDAHLEALVERGRFENPIHQSELLRILIGRRDAILERFLTRLSPLTWPAVREGEEGRAEICAQDLATWTGIRDADTRHYSARAWMGDSLAEAPPLRLRRGGNHYLCAELPELGPLSEPQYTVVDILAQSEGSETTHPARFHLYALGNNRYQLVGLERPDGTEVPRP